MDTTGSNGTAPTAADAGGTEAKRGVLQRLYTGTGAFDIVGKRKYWYVILGALMLVSALFVGIKGFNLSIEFEGGTNISMPAQGASGQITTTEVENSFQEVLGSEPSSVQLVGSGGSQTVQINTEKLSQAELVKVKSALFEDLRPLGTNGQPSADAISDSAVSGTWGSEITQQALIALAVFLVLVTVFLAFYFERWMAVGALVALLHDVLVTAGIYSMVGFQVSPSTVIGLLTILGFSLYDTVVVFDKVKENTSGLLSTTRRTYPEAANLAVNQSLMRSINTSVIALLPVLGLLVVGAGLLGVGVLRDLALVQGVGMLAGVLSSLLLATPLLVDLKMRESKYRAHAEKVAQRRRNRDGEGSTTVNGAGTDADSVESARPARDGTGGAKLAGAGAANAGAGAARPSGKAGRRSSGRKRR
ncbi:protein translocase subunit SecF [Actinopolyspora erythraea]|uniref:Protein-export membrane protein SecF n=1 Tax=Actinopolyspora erythraea TaxID=414996 RepID=A0A099D466_9ACTN|nr:protein translocase subunit SecF [Actinopolyspora erythraea]ASU79419.1 protein translocase subunit SecF [Actinopolyspora erythraea]KGI80963.1 preprotein translocase subunit SecF [Actinopolyspora erythraea]